MTREECEKKVGSLLQDIHDIVEEYNPKIDSVCISVSKKCVWAFAIDDEHSDDEHNEYFLNINIWQEDIEDE